MGTRSTRTITVSDEDFGTIIDALNYTAEDYAYRADFEEKHDGDEQAKFEAQAERYAEVMERITDG